MATSQKTFVLQHLLRFGSIDPLTALREYDCYRLGAVIFVLRNQGYNISTVLMNSRSSITGRPSRFAKYILQK